MTDRLPGRSTEPIRIHSDVAFLPESRPCIPMLYPFWADLGDRSPPSPERLKTYVAAAPSLFEMVELADCDWAVLPFNWEYATWDVGVREMGLEFLARAREAGKRAIVFYESDVVQDVPADNAIVFGTSLHRSRLRPQQFILPAWTEDLLKKYADGQVQIRAKGSRPVVGFCGSAPPLRFPWGAERAKETARWVLHRIGVGDRLSISPASYLRVQAIRQLTRDPGVETNFVIRSGVNRPLSNTPGSDPIEPDLQRAFFKNMEGSDYIVCSRGFGNFSYRFYETLAVGRIPVFIDTDCVLPFEDEIDWRRRCVWIDQTDIAEVGHRVAEFHSQLTSEEFEELQIGARDLWDRWLSPAGFLSRFLNQTGVA